MTESDRGSALVRPSVPEDDASVARLLRAAFGRQDEAHLVAELTEGGHLAVSFVAVIGEAIVGYVAMSKLPIEQVDGVVRGVGLAPLAVAAPYRRRGIGARLVWAALDAARSRGADAVVVLGEPSYYRRFGFSAELGARLSAPFSGPSFMALELLPATLARGGRVCYAPPFGLGAY